MDVVFVSICLIIVILIVLSVWLYSSGYCEPFGDLSYNRLTDPYERPFLLPNLLTSKECQDIIDYSRNRLVDSETVGIGIDKGVRNSKQVWIGKSDPLVKGLYEKVVGRFGLPVDNAEDLQVVRYEPNQYYREHHDSCCDNNVTCEEFIKRGGQRVLTVLVYLNDGFTDGETYFPGLRLKMKPKRGDAIVFYPLGKGGSKCHPLALHAGLPVSSGEKWVANVWFREGRFY